MAALEWGRRTAGEGWTGVPKARKEVIRHCATAGAAATPPAAMGAAAVPCSPSPLASQVVPPKQNIQPKTALDQRFSSPSPLASQVVPFLQKMSLHRSNSRLAGREVSLPM